MIIIIFIIIIVIIIIIIIIIFIIIIMGALARWKPQKKAFFCSTGWPPEEGMAASSLGLPAYTGAYTGHKGRFSYVFIWFSYDFHYNYDYFYYNYDYYEYFYYNYCQGLEP